MNLTVAGKDRTGDLGRQMAEEAARLRTSGSIGALSPEHSALVLKSAADRADYLRRFIELLRLRHGLRTADYHIPRGPGLRGKVALVLKTVLWKLLRYQHDRMAFQQNAVNELAIDALEFQQGQFAGELADLRRRLAALEQNRGGGCA
jgi:hypothetical protein